MQPEIVLRDGDLLQRPEALEILQLARQKTKGPLELWTSGLNLARPGVVEAVLRAGANLLAVPLYGDGAESHDWLTGQPGHFQRTIAGLKRARALGSKVAVIAPLLRPSFRNLPLLVQKSHALEVSSFHFVTLPGPDRAGQPLLPSLEMVAPHLRQALNMVQAGKRRATVLDVPACLLAERAPLTMADDHKEMAPTAVDLPTREYGPPCEACTWRGTCPGLLATTATRFGWAGLMARTDLPPKESAPGVKNAK